MPALPYREPPPPEPAPIEPDVGVLRSVHTRPPLYRALVGPAAIAALAFGVASLMEVPIVVGALLGVVLLAVLAYAPIRLRDVSVEVHAGGLVLRKGGARRVVPFSEVNEVWFELERIHDQSGARLRALRLVDFSGASHHVPLAFEGGAVIAGAVVREASEPLLAEARQALREGATLTFGRIQLDGDGVASGKKRIDFRSTQLVVFQRGKVFFYRRWPIVPSLTVRLDRIPNPTVFSGLVTQRALKVRVDDLILIPFATGEEEARAIAQGGEALALRMMRIGGLWFLGGVAVTCVTYAHQSGSYILAYGPILFGGYRFVQGLVAYLAARRR